MTAENTNSTLGQESTTWLACLLGEYLGFMVYPSTVLSILIILYYPLLVSFSVVYLGSALYFFCGIIYNLPDDRNSKQWDKSKKKLAVLSDVIGKILHGYEICGVENLPKGPALLVYYHGAIPVDYYFFVLRIYRITGRLCCSVLDHFIFCLPGLKRYLYINQCANSTREECVELLKQGNLLGIAPGGLREQNYGDHTYKLVWGKRKGFAQVAIDAKVPIIPIFTQNLREGYRIYGNIRPMRWLYEQTRILFFPQYGLIPVKLRTHIGQPIPYDPNITAEELAEKTKTAMEALRDKHQKIPGSIMGALWERFEVHQKND
ncbi:transmembrane protein 68-like [Sceloporus undulatus]|uniref:transmembrane protein 68-like n=1 Tax=Sceloporus undulatus TaxID=8520 RepID=UPI001C4C6807|nr:transmembrane protein 68-like [Sceloporus undulatus]